VASRTLSRRALRDEHDQAEQIKRESEVTGEPPAPEAKVRKPRSRKATAVKPAGVKAIAKPRVRKKAAKVPPVLFARWAVCDNGMKRVATFAYKDRVGADAKLSQMQDRKTGTYFLQLVKDPCDPPAVVAEPAG
jgi:hypothetical protein